ncbi:hypothetical protein NECAME_05703 [Necator americanus]|uniref:Uncharacterized protein n=1 Tax=Necator americanus TaxID=51031 RepID=W2SHK3_NECAM|nr:hypothetical protein NECAME_05703 [Necator americanus]ETN68222.1 hypothetical protein NECAME_05703 [Necator americanus]
MPLKLKTYYNGEYCYLVSQLAPLLKGKGGQSHMIKWSLTFGRNATDVTKSTCWKQHKHSLRDKCHNFTVLSIPQERMK